jgi:hypothetical protein
VSDHDLIGAYFDRELDEAATAAFEQHLVGCAQCQAELEDLMGMEAALRGRGEADVKAKAPEATVTPITAARRRRWVAPVLVAGALAAAVALFVMMRRGGGREATAPVAVALADKRGVEVRFAAPAFDLHRPYSVVRGAPSAESIPMATLAALEKRGDHAALFASHALARELDRAQAMAATLGESADGAADRAALALLRGRPEEALALTEVALRTDRRNPHALWNRALALRDLELSMASAAAFDAVAELGEPGWSDEARERAGMQRARVLERDRAFADLGGRAQTQIAGTPGGKLAPADARSHPGFTRIFFLDAVRTAGDAAALDALAPVAAELDAVAGDSSATAALAAALAADLGVRARFHDRYRRLIKRTLPAADGDRLVAELAAAGPAVSDVYVGALIAQASSSGELPGLAALERALGPSPSPWFALILARARIAAHRAAGRDVLAELTAALAACTTPSLAWSYRCGALELDLAQVLGEAGRTADAIAHTERSRGAYVTAGAPVQEDAALAYQGELARHGGRDALAAAIFDEVARRSHGRDCEIERYSQAGVAALALVRGDLEATRFALPDPAMCPQAPADVQAIVTAVDLARQSGSADDWKRAEAWLAAGRLDPATSLLTDVGAARLLIDRDPPIGAAAAETALQALPADDPAAAGIRAWAFSALVDDGARRNAWAEVLADAGSELGVTLPGTCVVVASVDDDRVVVATLDAGGAAHGSLRRVVVAEQAKTDLVPDELERGLSGCAAIAVVARPPLEGRPDLLAIDLPWYFVGGAGPANAGTPPAAKDVLIVTDPATTSPRLGPASVPGARVVTGAEATPSRVLAALGGATYVELHVHGVVDLDVADASHLVLAPDADGTSVLTARDVRAATLRGAPVVVLAACRASETAPHLQVRWSLPDAFVAAGARAVIAADVDLPDDEAAAFFTTLRQRLDGGESPAKALAAARAQASGGKRDHWAAHVMLFQPVSARSP